MAMLVEQIVVSLVQCPCTYSSIEALINATKALPSLENITFENELEQLEQCCAHHGILPEVGGVQNRDADQRWMEWKLTCHFVRAWEIMCGERTKQQMPVGTMPQRTYFHTWPLLPSTYPTSSSIAYPGPPFSTDLRYRPGAKNGLAGEKTRIFSSYVVIKARHRCCSCCRCCQRAGSWRERRCSERRCSERCGVPSGPVGSGCGRRSGCSAVRHCVRGRVEHRRRSLVRYVAIGARPAVLIGKQRCLQRPTKRR